jgi:hypothetical protein
MSDRPEGNAPSRAETEQPRRKYEKPRLIEYGHVAKLTQSGGLSTKDFGSMMRP